MAKGKGNRRATDVGDNLKKLFDEYRAAKSDLRVKQQAARAAAARALELRVRISALIQAKGLDVYRTVYAVEGTRGGQPVLRKLVSGKNLILSDLHVQVMDFTGGSTHEACQQGLEDATQQMEDSGEAQPGMSVECDCSVAQVDMNGQKVTVAVVDCVAGYPT